MRAKRNLRPRASVARGILLAISCAALSISAHIVAHGGLPNIAITVLLAGLIGWTGTGIADRIASFPAILGTLGFAQFMTHLMLSELAPHGPHDSLFTRNSFVENSSILNSSWAMVSAHTVATVITAMVVTRADSLLTLISAGIRLVANVMWRLISVTDRSVETPSRPVPNALDHRQFFISVIRCHARRGPPQFY